MRTLYLAVLIGVLASCAGPLPTRTPMPVIRYPATAHRHDTLLVLLPGRKDRAAVFAREGFLAAVRGHGLAADVVATDAHAGYYERGSVVAQLHRELIEPAHQRGYRRIILVGVSVGGYGAIRYAMAHPREVSTIVLLAPFLGAGPFMRQLAEAGDEDFRQTWDWLKGYPAAASAAERAAAGYPHIVLGYGEEDLFLATDKQLRALLPPSDVFTTPGAHVWSTWRTLLTKLLDSGILGK